MIRPRIKRSRKGGVDVRLPPDEREFLATLGPQMRELFESESGPESDLALARLFPVAYPDHDDRETEYRLLVHDELRESLLGAMEILEASVAAEHLSADEAAAWMRALNQVRLVLGSRLGVSEEGTERPTSSDDPRLPAFAAYDYLSLLQGQLIDALAP